jgi:adenosylcobinamide-phosphate synthase
MSTLFIFAILLALMVDHFLGEPPVRWHPVVWMGNALERCAPWVSPSPSSKMYPKPTSGNTDVKTRDWSAFSRGAFVWTALSAVVWTASWGLQWVVLLAPLWLAAALLGIALKPLLAWRMLRTEVQAVEAALQVSLSAGRERLGWLVSRDVTQLSESQVRESAIESLAENLNDSVVAPIFWFLVLGLPGAALYRFANTADAMWGYKGVYKGRNWEWAGKWAARVDDVLSWLPARLTALALAIAAGGLAPRQLRREAGRTASPNSGWPMAAMALALGVCLHKPGVYALNAIGRPPQAVDTAAALRLAGWGLFSLLATVLIAQSAVVLLAYLAASGGAA